MFELAIALGIGRLVVFCGLALIGRVRERRRQVPSDQEGLSVSVLIPAYNEARVIGTSIRHILASTHQNLNVIVIDDGSTDGTSEVVRTCFSEEARVKLITTQNGGKARAVNLGLARATGDIVVVLDADTQFEPADHIEARALVCRSEDRRRRWKRKGRQPHQHADALAGA